MSPWPWLPWQLNLQQPLLRKTIEKLFLAFAFTSPGKYPIKWAQIISGAPSHNLLQLEFYKKKFLSILSDFLPQHKHQLSWMLDAKKIIGKNQYFSSFFIQKFLPYCSLKISDINAKKILVVPIEFFMFSIQDNCC